MPHKTLKARREYYKRYKVDHWPEMKERMANYYERNKDLVAEFKRRPCADCRGWYEPCQMDFDHRPGETKKFNISGKHTLILRTLLPELRKCDVVCANCHRLRTYIRGQHCSNGPRRMHNNILPANPRTNETRVQRPVSLYHFD